MKKFNRFVTDVKNGIKRKLSSRRLKIQVSVDEFDLLSKKYFLGIKSDIVTFKFKVDPGDKDIVLFILRAYYGLWIEINDLSITIYSKFPEKFVLTKEVNKSNHHFTPKTFAKGTIMYSVNSAYSSSNGLSGTSLWDNLNPIEGTDLIPSIQINYDFIKPIKV